MDDNDLSPLVAFPSSRREVLVREARASTCWGLDKWGLGLRPEVRGDREARAGPAEGRPSGQRTLTSTPGPADPGKASGECVVCSGPQPEGCPLKIHNPRSA